MGMQLAGFQTERVLAVWMFPRRCYQ